MQNGNKTFVVVGTDHELQKPECSSSFADFVLELCRYYKVDFIGEEANGMKTSHAKSVSSLVGANWANVDITLKERESMRLGDTWDASLSCDDRFLVNSRELFLEAMEQREWVWVARTTNRTRHSGLIICGVVHTLSVSSKLASVGHRVYPHYFILPSEIGPGELT